MLRCYLCLFLVTWCLLCTSARPARRSFALYRASRLNVAVRPSNADLDQTAEASSLVDDYVPQQGNSLLESRLAFPRRKFSSLYALPEEQPAPSIIKDCANCDPLDGVVTLGESRSYSVVTNPRPEEPAPGGTPLDDTVTQWVTSEPETTTEPPTTEEVTTAENTIISVRVSSSVGSSGYQVLEPASLLTEDRPFATAVQRSHFSVEEASHESVTSSAVGAPTEKQDFRSSHADINQLETTKSVISSSDSATARTLPATSPPFRYYPTPNDRTDRSLFIRNPIPVQNKHQSRLSNERTAGTTDPQSYVVVENASPPANPLSSPVSYRTSLKSATSGSSVSFYREPPNFNRPTVTESTQTLPPVQTERLKHETRVETVSYHEEVAVPQRPAEKAQNRTGVDAEKSYQFTNVHDSSFHHVQVTHLGPGDKKRALPYSAAHRYGRPEKVYGMPEQNYEVEEALSVRSNGRAHGVQGAPTARPDNNKFGYVVEGRDFKKYRVEERTADGFIVGEYGVVRHDDGSLRGVRYTADSTINPKVIYEALVKFLSL